MTFQTEVEFTLPKGYLDGDGALHRDKTFLLSASLSSTEG